MRANLENNPTLDKKSVQIVQKILSKNDIKANELRQKYVEDGLYVINFMSSPGSGKTTLLENLGQFEDFKFCVVEGDLQTNRDAERLQKKGIAAEQVTTGEACHLEASMVEHAYGILKQKHQIQECEYLIIENVGNLVCPASYDLGAALNIVLLSVPEGDDKILKYPSMFMCADAVIVSKSDMIDYFGFRISQVKEDMQKLKPQVPIFLTSSKDPESLAVIKDFIINKKKEKYFSNHSF
ncbi:hydrogenase nickel incorporation protein HypB [Helicobacter mustelae]|uniref:Hydrogenase isoenzymes formation protein n=1 Tax=Helicobacter mustelae (strain ATCC 43772 / CCUG 25715 / CIP 103759 / LMG 18044 / NCTC 12198 / R85-136P) TaxID=679897 RepID=D3UI20_HELM1|nr:hydrogenase nickel incorporation protein HypB [Helicobacter mustelae]CBG40143.1 hydrogenase isoenzymes formation protein [Helicobacter mustelae 12198]SQH71646.1 hydrogenase isoenzymes formation protein [Helicobacter mustelae]